MSSTRFSSAMRDRARGVLLGQLTGDALGTTVEFAGPEDIRRRFPTGLRDIVGGGPFKVQPGQVTDDGELALTLARALVAHGWELDARARAYAAWFNSGPFDVGGTTSAAFGGWGQDDVAATTMLARSRSRNGAPGQQANGALMRVSPIAIHGTLLDASDLAERAREDARFSHPSPVCQAANAAFVRAIQVGLAGGSTADAHQAARAIAADCPEVAAALDQVEQQPQCHGSKQGWVLVALRNAFHMLLHEPSFEEAIVRTVMAGGDTDTNACITGALLGSFHGLSGIPPRWIVKVLACRTGRGTPYQTTDAIPLADELLERGALGAKPQGKTAVDQPVGQVARPGAAKPRPVRQTKLKGHGGHRPQPEAAPMTSWTHPIRVDWLSVENSPGRLGITIAPGKHSRSAHHRGRWERDLDKDLGDLVNTWKAGVLVCLLEPGDLVRLQIPDLVQRGEAHGLDVLSFPIRDVSVPVDTAAVHRLVTTMHRHVREGRNVVVHCEGGLGRSGVVAGCYLAAQGFKSEDIFDTLRRARGSSCPETEQQRRFIRDFVREHGR